MHSRICLANRALSLRCFHSHSRASSQALVEKTPAKEHQSRPRNPQKTKEISEKNEDNDVIFAKRNEVGVQLLSRRIHSQIFKNVTFPSPQERCIQIAKEHLQKHNLDPTASSTHPDISFTLPPLQGATIDSHFHSIGEKTAQPYLSMSKELASATLPPRPESWVLQSGWTKYWSGEDGLHESVESPEEELLVFDIETLPKHHNFAVMACAASPKAWYAWISPWLLKESTDPQQLIPLGDPSKPRLVVGHNVSYDRARTLEEYSLERPGTRWLDTMALHVAVNGISSHQRPAWSNYRKQKEQRRTMRNEAIESVFELINELKGQLAQETNEHERSNLQRRVAEIEDSLPSLLAIAEVGGESSPDGNSDALAQKRWEDLTSANSLADVAFLHCGIEVDKSTRDDFMTLEPEAIHADLSAYLTYCANDVAITHQVFCKALPAFLEKCPSPVSFAGVCSMGSSFLTVDEGWDHYLEMAEGTYRHLEKKVVHALRTLAEEARKLIEGDKWKGDVWLEQLDWTPKKPRKKHKIKPKPEVGASGELKPIGDELRSEESPSYHQSPRKRDRRIPKFYNDMTMLGFSHPFVLEKIMPYVLRMQYLGEPVHFDEAHGWHSLKSIPASAPLVERIQIPKKKLKTIFNRSTAFLLYRKGELTRCEDESMKYWVALAVGEVTPRINDVIRRSALRMIKIYSGKTDKYDWKKYQPWADNLDWTPVEINNTECLGPVQPVPPKKIESEQEQGPKTEAETDPNDVPITEMVPTWYWQLGQANVPTTPNNLLITTRSRVAPILLKLKWQGWPLVFSREHGWTFRVPRAVLKDGSFTTRHKEVSFYDDADAALAAVSGSGNGEYAFFKLPHKDGEEANVGSPLAKPFVKFAADETLSSPGETAKEALDINAQSSYWISARDRIMKQMVVWDTDGRQGLQSLASPGKKWGMILPQVITMGTVTRRAIEKTWLTASNAKKDRIGSELKAMVRAPKGYAIVGADVDSEELWISSCMGDAQFGLHGATAIGWMTLEGTKKAGTDLHSKTASILGISRDQAKVFNYSRIYGAGQKHAMLLLLQSNASMLPEAAQRLAENLYASTKGKNTHRGDFFDHKFWYGGTESFVFNKLEEIALSDEPKTPALGCGVTYALSKQYLPEKFGSDYLPSRINWVVQSSGVDYLHLLIVAMEHLLKVYDISARYLISVHDELRYIVKDEDKYRAALALQIANLWTRSLFAYRLGMDDLPQGVAFFSAVDVDTVLRKEVDMPCVTLSQPVPIPPGESLDIRTVLEKTNGGSLKKDGSPMEIQTEDPERPPLETYIAPDCLVHRAKSINWLKAQATDRLEEVKYLAEKERGGQPYKNKKKTKELNKLKLSKAAEKLIRRVRKPTKLANVESMETWTEEEVEKIIRE